MHLIYKRLKVLHHTLSVILTNVDSSRNLKKCTRILANLLIALLLLFSAMLFPFAMFAFNLNMWANLMPFALVIAVVYYIRNLVVLIDGHHQSVPSYAASFSVAKF